MDERIERHIALGEFHTFVSGLRANQARIGGVGKPDPDIRPGVIVDAPEVLNCFLRKNPEYEPYREDIRNGRDYREIYEFDRDEWKRENEG